MGVNIGPKIGIDGEAEYRKQINNIIQQTKTLKSEYDALSASFSKGSTSLKDNAEKHRILTEQIKVQKDRVSELQHMVEESAKKYGEADTKTLKWKEALNQANKELNEMQGELKTLPNNVELVGQKMATVGGKIKTAGDDLTNFGRAITPVSAAAAAGLGAAAKSFMDFEAGMSKVAAISGATGSDLDALTEKAKEMGATTKFSASESAEAFTYMAMAGWKTEQMLDGIAPIMNLAAASGEDLATTSDIVTDALTAFGLKAEDAGRFADVLAAASSNANTNVAMMGESFKYAAPIAGSLGYSIEDTAVALGLMANSGIKADMAGTSLRNMLNRMAKPTKESQMAMDRLGLSLADANGNMYSLREIMEQMRASFSNINMPVEEFERQVSQLDSDLDDGIITEKEYQKELEELAKQAYGAEGAEKARAAAMLGGTRAMSAMLAIANASEEDYQKLTSAVDGSSQSFAKLADGSIVPLNEALKSGQEIIEQYNGTAEEMAKIMEDNAKGSWTEAKSALEGAGIAAGEVLAPYITQAANAVKDLANWFSELDESEQQTIVKAGAIVAAAGPVLTVGGKIVSGLGSMVTGAGNVVSAFGKMGPALSGAASSAASFFTADLGAAMSAGGAAAAGTAAATIGAEIVTFFAGAEIGKKIGGYLFPDSKEIYDEYSGIKGTMLMLKDTALGVADVVKWGVEDAWKAAGNAGTTFKERMKSDWSEMKTNAKTNWDGIKDSFRSATDSMKSTWDSTAQKFKNKYEEIKSGARSLVESLKAAFKFDWSLPKIKLPHFKISGEFSLNPPKVPSISVDWYSKAMQKGMKLDGATIFGAGKSGLMGGGEAGSEWIVGEGALMNMIRSAVRQVALPSGGGNTVTIGETNITINAAEGQDVMEIADAVDEIINARYKQAEAAWA
ncbi:MAG: phage tail tape measure protein [Lachnospiraceae bacterium]|nr:phage tail tape measure protein [Lachnospiraceae bacterium]MBR3374192.1 phage tail tape measure protein [Bacillota bacterium]